MSNNNNSVVYVMFQDGQMLGYVTSESDARNAMVHLADTLTKTLLRTENDSKIPIRFFRETIECGIRIYTQTLGVVYNGAVVLRHVLNWTELAQYRMEAEKEQNDSSVTVPVADGKQTDEKSSV